MRSTERRGPYPDVTVRAGTGRSPGTEFSIRTGVRTSTDGRRALRLPQCASIHLICVASCARIVPEGNRGKIMFGCPPPSQATLCSSCSSSWSLSRTSSDPLRPSPRSRPRSRRRPNRSRPSHRLSRRRRHHSGARGTSCSDDSPPGARAEPTGRSQRSRATGHDYPPGEPVASRGPNLAPGELVSHPRELTIKGETWRCDVDVIAGNDGRDHRRSSNSPTGSSRHTRARASRPMCSGVGGDDLHGRTPSKANHSWPRTLRPD